MTNVTPETLLKTARITYPEYEWELIDNKLFRSINSSAKNIKRGSFDPVNNDSDQLALWYELADRFIVIFKGHYGDKTACFWGWRNEETGHESDGYPSLIEALIAAVEAVQL